MVQLDTCTEEVDTNKMSNLTHLTTHQQRLLKILEWGGAKIEDTIFITKPVVKIIKSTSLHPDFKAFLPELNMCGSEINPDYLASAEFNARLTYLAYPTNLESASQSLDYNNKMIHQHNHLSVFNDFYVGFLIAGISDETMKELLAHVEHRASRLTSSKTKAQDSTFYRLQGTSEQMQAQKNFINNFLKLKNQIDRSDNNVMTTEFANMLNLSVKACAFVYTMSLKDLKKMITGRLPEFGNETEIRQVASMMQDELIKNYPVLFSNITEPKPQTINIQSSETHYVNIEKYQEIIKPIVSSLNNQIFIDIGCAHGEIGMALNNLNKLESNWYFGWEISNDKPFDQLQNMSQCVFYNRNYRDGLQDIPPNSIIISNPPYSELENIMKHIKVKQLKYILMTSTKYLDLFVGAKLLGILGPKDFIPVSDSLSTHLVFTNIN